MRLGRVTKKAHPLDSSQSSVYVLILFVSSLGLTGIALASELMSL